MSARHHLVPQFYLRNFADESDQVLLINRDDFTQVHRSAVKNAAVEVGFYRIETEELRREEDRATHDPEVIETHLSGLESRMAPVVVRMMFFSAWNWRMPKNTGIVCSPSKCMTTSYSRDAG